MKKECFALLVLFSLSFVFAAPQLILDSSNHLGESVLGVVDFDEGTELLDDLDFVFKEGRKSASLNYEVLNYKEDYYFYIYPATAGDYSLALDGILYQVDGITQTVDLGNNFSVTDSENNVLSVKPGFITTLDEAELTITNKGNNSLDVNTPNEDFTLGPLGSKKVVVDPDYDLTFFDVVSYKTFSIPVIYYGGDDTPSNYTSNSTDDDGLFLHKKISVNPENISLNLSSSGQITKTIIVENTGDLDIEDLYIDSDYNFSLDNITLAKGESFEFEIEIKANDSDGTITVGLSTTEIEIPVSIYVDTSILTEESSCSDLGGTFCDIDLNLTCDGEVTFTEDYDEIGGLCCLSSCEGFGDDGSSMNWGVIIGILLLLILGGGGYFVYKKYSGTTGPNRKVGDPVEGKDPQRQRPAKIEKEKDFGEVKVAERKVDDDKMKRHNRRVPLE